MVAGKQVAPEMVVDFLGQIMPFKELPKDVIADVARKTRIDFFPKGTKLLVAGKTEPKYLYIIQQGGVRCFLVNESGEVTLKDYRGEGDCIAALPLIRSTPANLDVETVEDTFCFLIPKKVFVELLRTQQGFTHYYLKQFSEKIVTNAYAELRKEKMERRSDDDLYLFSIRVADLIKSRLRKVSAETSIKETASLMSEFKVGSMLIHAEDDDNKIIGILTDSDLRKKVVARGVAYKNPVVEVMSSPVVTVLSKTTCFDALIKMMTTGVHHLAVERQGNIIGVVTSHDIMVLQGTAPYSLFREIDKQQEIANLYPLSQKIPDIIRNLIKEGARASHVARMIALLNDQILRKMLSLLEGEMGKPPVPYCWLLMGSEGRREQTFKTDQDNAIVYLDPVDEAQARQAEEYFAEFSRRAIDHLVNCGYPLCPGDIMARNPKWCQPLSVWKKYFANWVSNPDPQEILLVTIFFDFRGVYGDMVLADDLRNYLVDISKQQEIYLLHLARECIATKVPLSFFRSFIVAQSGEQKNKLDLKKQGLTPFVNFARIMALKYGVKETNTLSRLQILKEEGHLGEELWHEVKEAYELQMQLRLIHQLSMLEDGKMPDNYIDPARLSDLEKRMLKDAFKVIERMQAVLKSIFPLG